MERRSKLLILIVTAVALLALGLWILLSPILRPGSQPPPLPGNVRPNATVPTSTRPIVPATPAPAAMSPDIKKLQDQAAVFVARMGSGSSVDGFQGYDDVALSATVAYRATLDAEQLALQRAHPASGAPYGITTRVVSTDARDAVAGAATVRVTVQVQRAEDAGNPAAPTSVTYQAAVVTFEKQANGNYLVNGVTWEDVEL